MSLDPSSLTWPPVLPNSAYGFCRARGTRQKKAETNPGLKSFREARIRPRGKHGRANTARFAGNKLEGRRDQETRLPPWSLESVRHHVVARVILGPLPRRWLYRPCLPHAACRFG